MQPSCGWGKGPPWSNFAVPKDLGLQNMSQTSVYYNTNVVTKTLLNCSFSPYLILNPLSSVKQSGFGIMGLILCSLLCTVELIRTGRGMCSLSINPPSPQFLLFCLTVLTNQWQFCPHKPTTSPKQLATSKFTKTLSSEGDCSQGISTQY